MYIPLLYLVISPIFHFQGKTALVSGKAVLYLEYYRPQSI